MARIEQTYFTVVVFLSCLIILSTISFVSTPRRIPSFSQYFKRIRRIAALLLPNANISSQLKDETLSQLRNSFSRCFNNKKFLKITYFIFSKVKLKENISEVEDFSFLKSRPNVENPCRTIFSSLNLGDYDFVFAIDESVRIFGEIDACEAFLVRDDLVALVHPFSANISLPKSFSNRKTKPLPVRDPRLLLYYSERLFGGTGAAINKICSEIGNHSNFQTKLNELLHGKKPPTAVLCPKELTNNSFCNQRAVKMDVTVLVGDDVENIEPPDAIARRLEVDSELHQFSLLQESAERIASAIRKNYIEEVKNALISRNSNVTTKQRLSPGKFISAECTFDQVYCGGLGDRFRGLVVAFYLALATGRVFHVQHTKPVDLAEFFTLNDRLYEVPSSVYNSCRATAVKSQRDLDMTDKRGEIVYFLQSPQVNAAQMQSSYLSLTANRYSGLQSLLRTNKAFSEIVRKVAEFDGNSSLEYAHFDFPLFISAAYRTVFQHGLTAKFQQLFDDAIESTIGFQLWNNSVKIGVQVRLEKQVGFADYRTRVTPSQLGCFAEEIKLTIRNKIRRSSAFRNTPNIVVFVTSDWNQTLGALRENLTDVDNVTLFETGKKQHLSIIHIDQRKDLVGKANSWLMTAKTYLDWLILTKMDFLVITRSGFGETASMASLKPTRRFIYWDFCHFQDYNIYTSDVVNGPLYEIL